MNGRGCPSPRGIRFQLCTPEEAVANGASYSSWSLRPALVWWFFGILLVVIPWGIEYGGWLPAVYRSPDEIEADAPVRNHLFVGLIAFYVIAFGGGALRAATYEHIVVENDRCHLRWKFTPWVTWKSRRFRVPVPVMLVRASSQFGNIGYREVGVLVCFRAHDANVCVAGFKTEGEARDWIGRVPQSRIRVDEVVRSWMVSTVPFP